MKGLKTGGRQQGSTNLLTSTAKEILFSVIDNEIANLPELLKELEPKDRALLLSKLLPYRYPKVVNELPDISERIVIHIDHNI